MVEKVPGTCSLGTHLEVLRGYYSVEEPIGDSHGKHMSWALFIIYLLAHHPLDEVM